MSSSFVIGTPGKGWFITDFQGDNGTLQGTIPGPQTGDAALPELQVTIVTAGAAQGTAGLLAVNGGSPSATNVLPIGTGPVQIHARVTNIGRAALLQSVLERLSRPDDQLQVGVANILDFRPDLQLATSTAVVLSARFPFVTPPGAIVENARIVRSSGLYQKTKVLELTDGAFYDNSGGIVARDIILALNRLLEKDERFKDFKDNVRFHLIRFTDTPAKRQGGASESGHFELVTPLVAYDAVRQSRGVLLSRPPQGTGISNVYLLDEWYGGTLNWLLSRDTKLAVEKRSSWLKGFENEVCSKSVTPPRADGRGFRWPPTRRRSWRRASSRLGHSCQTPARFSGSLRSSIGARDRTGRQCGKAWSPHPRRRQSCPPQALRQQPPARPAAHPRVPPHRRRRGSLKTASGRS